MGRHEGRVKEVDVGSCLHSFSPLPCTDPPVTLILNAHCACWDLGPKGCWAALCP